MPQSVIFESFQEFAARMNCDSVRFTGGHGLRTGLLKATYYFANGAISIDDPIAGQTHYSPEHFDQRQLTINRREYTRHKLERVEDDLGDLKRQFQREADWHTLSPENYAPPSDQWPAIFRSCKQRIKQLRRELAELKAALTDPGEVQRQQELAEIHAARARRQDEIHREVANVLMSDE